MVEHIYWFFHGFWIQNYCKKPLRSSLAPPAACLTTKKFIIIKASSCNAYKIEIYWVNSFVVINITSVTNYVKWSIFVKIYPGTMKPLCTTDTCNMQTYFMELYKVYLCIFFSIKWTLLISYRNHSPCTRKTVSGMLLIWEISLYDIIL